MEEDRNLNRRQNDKWDIWDTRIRDSALFIAGFSGIIHEVFLIDVPRPSILMFLGSLVGLPLVLGAEKKRRKDEDSGQ